MARTGILLVVILLAACAQTDGAGPPRATQQPTPAATRAGGTASASPGQVSAPDTAWQTQTDSQPCCLVGHGSAVLGHGDTVLLADTYEGAGVTALDAATGERRWQARLDGSVVFVGDLDDHVAIVHGQYDWYAALDPDTGDQRWRVQLDPEGYGAAGVTLVGSDTAVVSITTPSEGDQRAPEVLRIDTTDGQPEWRTDLHESSEMQWSAPIVVGDQILVQTTPDNPASRTTNTLHALDLHTGELLWQSDLGGRQGFFEAPPVVTNGVVIARGADLHGIDLATGQVRWTTAGSFPLWARPDGSVVVAVRSDLTAIASGNGAHAATIETSGPFDPSSIAPVVADDQVIIATPQAILAFDRASGDLVWRHVTETPPADLTVNGDHVVALLRDGTVIGLNAR